MLIDGPPRVALAMANQSPPKRARPLHQHRRRLVRLTGEDCSPNTVHWPTTPWMLAKGTGKRVVKAGGKTPGSS
jgi:branched-chain amino acid transport system substrate-binding protein